MSERASKKNLGILMDMDGVIYRGKQAIPGAKEFVEGLIEAEIPFLFLTNISELGPGELLRRVEGLGIRGLSEDNFITAGMASALFLKRQSPGARVWVLGGEGLKREVEKAGLLLCDERPDYVLVGKTERFDFGLMSAALGFLNAGARFIGANPDLVDPTESGLEPACGTLLAALEAASGKKPYVIGKPNALMLVIATRKLGLHPDEAVMIGDRMDTDIVGGIAAGLRTCLVLSGVSGRFDPDAYPYKPDFVFDSLADIDPDIFRESSRN